MKKVISFLLILVLAFSCVSLTSFAKTGTTYYVDSDWGNDEYSGLGERSAWKTIEKASSMTYSAGDKILFKAGGVYEGVFNAKGDGTEENPITVSSYGNIKKDGLPLITTKKDENIFLIRNANGWVVENLEMTAPDGRGLLILSDDGEIMENITVRDCVFHDIYFKPMNWAWGDQSRSAVRIWSSGKGSRIDNVTLSGLNIYDCDYGVMTAGTNIESSRNIFVSPEVSYNQNFLFENLTLNNLLYDGIGGGSINQHIIRNCSLINTSLRGDWPTAPMWAHHTKNMLVENCEIAGATNPMDGMSVDVDGWSTDCTFQYIYSHDNVRFIRNCVYDDTTRNANCTVRYCLSVNDNKMDNSFGQLLTSGAYDYTILNDKPRYMDNFKFYNNTIVNGSECFLAQVENSIVANNIFYNAEGTMPIIKTDTFGFDDEDNLIFREFTSAFTNNCIYGYSYPIRSKNSVCKDPLFVGTDLTDPESFRLASNSPLIGKGIQVEEDMGEHDFYGNKLTDTHNIGCYDAPGVEDVVIEKTFSENISDFFSALAGYITGVFNYVIGLF